MHKQDSLRFAGRRAGWKTWLFCTLLLFVPVVGSSMATMYWLTREEPERYDAGASAVAGLALLAMVVVAYVILGAVVLLVMQVRA